MASEAPNVKAVRAEKDRHLVITWKGGAEAVVDVSKHLAEYAIFTPLRADDAFFHKAAVGERGWCVRWSGRHGDFLRHALASGARAGKCHAAVMAQGAPHDAGRGRRGLGRESSDVALL